MTTGHGLLRRAIASILATGFTALLLVMLQVDLRQPPSAGAVPLWWILPAQPPADTPPAGPESRTATLPPPVRDDSARRKPRLAPDRPAQAEPVSVAVTPAPPAPSQQPTVGASAQGPAEPASAPIPLRVDAEVLRSAHRTSRSAVMQMAQSSDAYVGDGPVSGKEQLAGEVAKTVKPDCLGPGGSLLDAPVIAYRMLKEICRVR